MCKMYKLDKYADKFDKEERTKLINMFSKLNKYL